MTQPDDQKNRFLDYGKADRKTIARDVAATFVGVVSGALVISLAGCGTFMAANLPLENTTGKPPSLTASIFFFALALVAGVGVVLSAQRRKWFVIGCCLGSGLMCIVEGCCFGNVGG